MEICSRGAPRKAQPCRRTALYGSMATGETPQETRILRLPNASTCRIRYMYFSDLACDDILAARDSNFGRLHAAHLQNRNLARCWPVGMLLLALLMVSGSLTVGQPSRHCAQVSNQPDGPRRIPSQCEGTGGPRRRPCQTCAAASGSLLKTIKSPKKRHRSCTLAAALIFGTWRQPYQCNAVEDESLYAACASSEHCSGHGPNVLQQSSS